MECRDALIDLAMNAIAIHHDFSFNMAGTGAADHGLAINSLSRREAGLPSLGSLDANLSALSASRRVFQILSPWLTLGIFAYVYAMHWMILLPVAMLAHFIVVVAFTHDVVHGTAGLSRRATEWALFCMSPLMLASGHAFRWSHLHHHSHSLARDDFEGSPATMSLKAALMSGPTYMPRLWLHGYTHCKRAIECRWMAAELGTDIAFIIAALLLFPWTCAPLVYYLLVWIGGALFPISTAWLPHFKPTSGLAGQARTLRGKYIPGLFMNLTYHLEHHLYPQVPGVNLPRLATLLDPHFARLGVEPPRTY